MQTLKVCASCAVCCCVLFASGARGAVSYVDDNAACDATRPWDPDSMKSRQPYQRDSAQFPVVEARGWPGPRR